MYFVMQADQLSLLIVVVGTLIP